MSLVEGDLALRSFIIPINIKSLGQGSGPDNRDHVSETLNGTCHRITSRLVSLIEARGIEERKNGRKDRTKQQTHRGVMYIFQRAQGPGRVFRCG